MTFNTNYRLRLSDAQRRVIVALVFAVSLSSVHVDLAYAADVPPEPTLSVVQAAPIEVVTQPQIVAVTKVVQDDVDHTHLATITAYASVPWETDDSPFITADGTHVRDGIIAANFLKFGTRVRIPDLFGDKVFEVHDRMNKRFSDRVDIWMENVKLPPKFGIKRNVKIEILK